MQKEDLNIYPLTIIVDRYGGCYSGGRFTAWKLDNEDIPHDAFANDTSCAGFWDNNKMKVGLGNTPNEALEDLYKKIKHMIDISGYYLIAHGWERSKSNYKKGNDLITYNGTEWFLNGKEITSINEIP